MKCWLLVLKVFLSLLHCYGRYGRCCQHVRVPISLHVACQRAFMPPDGVGRASRRREVTRHAAVLFPSHNQHHSRTPWVSAADLEEVPVPTLRPNHVDLLNIQGAFHSASRKSWWITIACWDNSIRILMGFHTLMTFCCAQRVLILFSIYPSDEAWWVSSRRLLLGPAGFSDERLSRRTAVDFSHLEVFSRGAHLVTHDVSPTSSAESDCVAAVDNGFADLINHSSDWPRYP